MTRTRKPNILDLQALVRRTARYPGCGHNLMYPVVGLAGEIGELLEHIKKRVLRDPLKYGHMMSGERALRISATELSEGDKAKIIDELGDILWYVAALACELRVSLWDVVSWNMKKLTEREGSPLDTGTHNGSKPPAEGSQDKGTSSETAQNGSGSFEDQDHTGWLPWGGQ